MNHFHNPPPAHGGWPTSPQPTSATDVGYHCVGQDLWPASHRTVPPFGRSQTALHMAGTHSGKLWIRTLKVFLGGRGVGVGAAQGCIRTAVHRQRSPPPLLLPFQCLRLTAEVLLRRLRCQEDLRFKNIRPPFGGGPQGDPRRRGGSQPNPPSPPPSPSAGATGGPWEEGGSQPNPPPLQTPPLRPF